MNSHITITPDQAYRMGIILETQIVIEGSDNQKLKKKDPKVQLVVGAIAEYFMASKNFMNLQNRLVQEGITVMREQEFPKEYFSQLAVKASARFKQASEDLEKVYDATGLKCRKS